MLFDEKIYFQYKFPEPQYLGSKFTLLNWIRKHIPSGVKTALDAFAGSQSVAYLFKQLGFKTFTNDFLSFSHQIGIGLIENNKEILTKADVGILLNNHMSVGEYVLMEKTFSNIFFTKQEAKFLDMFRANVELLKNQYKKSLALSILNRSLTRKITMGHFGHSMALAYAKNPLRVKRNPNLARSIKDIFIGLVPQYNQAIFDNEQKNQSFNQNILDLLPKLNNVDVVYFDPPYCDSHADYQNFYHLIETYTEYWKDKKFVNKIKRYEPLKFSGFDKKKNVLESFEKLFSYAQDIPFWLISWNDRSFPSVDNLRDIIKKYKDVYIESKLYVNGRGGRGSVAGSKEILFICKNKPTFNFYFKKNESAVKV